MADSSENMRNIALQSSETYLHYDNAYGHQTYQSDFSILKFVTVLMSIEDKWNYNLHPSANIYIYWYSYYCNKLEVD